MERKEGLLHTINEGIHDMCYIWKKEMKTMFLDEGVLIFCIVVPLFYPLLYSWAYNNEVVRDIPVAVVDMSHSHMSREFIRMMDASPDTRVAEFCSDLEDGKRAMARQDVRGVLYFPSDFETKVMRMEQSPVSVYCDMSLMLSYKAVYQTAVAVSQQMSKGIQIQLSGNTTDRQDEIATQPLAYEEVPVFNSTGGYGNAVIPAVLIIIIQQTLLLGIGLSAGTARESNRYRDLVPVSRHYNGIFRIVLGKSLCYAMVYAVMGAYLTMVVPRIFGFTSMADRSALLALLTPYILSCIFFGMMLSCLIRYRENVILLVVFTSLPFLFLTGVSWPQTSIPGAWQAVSWLFPSTFGVRGFIRLNSMGASLSDITQEYQALWLQVLAYFFITCIVYRFQILHARRHALERLDNIKMHAKEAKTTSNE